jgi:hypothetical protein
MVLFTTANPHRAAIPAATRASMAGFEETWAL